MMREGVLQLHAVNGGSTIYKGSLVAVQKADGMAIACPANVGAGNIFAGIAYEGVLPGVTNTSDGDCKILVYKRGLFYYKVTGAAATVLGAPVYVTDDNNLTVTNPGGGIAIGKFMYYDGTSGYGWVEIDTTSQPGNGVEILKVPFVKKTSEFDSGYDLPANALVLDAFIYVTDAASGTIDVGLLSSESGGDADGFLDGIDTTTGGLVYPTIQNTTAATSNTVGAFLAAHRGIKSADTSAVYASVKKPFLTSSVTAKSISYTTADAAISGDIYFLYVRV